MIGLVVEPLGLAVPEIRHPATHRTTVQAQSGSPGAARQPTYSGERDRGSCSHPSAKLCRPVRSYSVQLSSS